MDELNVNVIRSRTNHTQYHQRISGNWYIMPQFLSYDVLHPATLQTSPKLPKIRLRWKPIPSHLSTIDSYIYHMIWQFYLPNNLGSYHMEYAPNSPGCRINLFGGDVQPAVDTKSLLFFKLCKHTILRNTSLLSPYKKKTWLRDVEGMNARGPTFFISDQKNPWCLIIGGWDCQLGPSMIFRVETVTVLLIFMVVYVIH